MRRAFGIAGWSGAGKTSLLVALLPELAARGLAVAVLKHDAHGLDGGDPRRDSERLHAAGARAVVALGPGEALARWRREDHGALPLDAVTELERRHDLVLVEGWKRASLPKLWLLRPGESAPPDDLPGIERVLPAEVDRVAIARAWLDERLRAAWNASPRRAGILAGGRSARMGSPKEALLVDGETLLARTARLLAPVGPLTVLGGAAHLPDAPDVAGPLAGLLAALRWSPQAWLIAACDLPRLHAEAIAWLLAQRAPGRWAVLPVVDDVAQPLLAVYEPQALALLERLAATGEGPSRLAAHPRVWAPAPPLELTAAWRGVNTPEEWQAFGRERADVS